MMNKNIPHVSGHFSPSWSVIPIIKHTHMAAKLTTEHFDCYIHHQHPLLSSIIFNWTTIYDPLEYNFPLIKQINKKIILDMMCDRYGLLLRSFFRRRSGHFFRKCP